MMPPGPTTPEEAANATTGGREMKAAVRREIDAPLAALRAAMEGVAGGNGGGVPPLEMMESALVEITRVGRNIDALVDFAIPPDLFPLSCNLEELVRGAHRSVPADIRGAVRLEIEGQRRSITVDGPLLTRCLGYLISAYVAASDSALLHAFPRSDEALFTLLCHQRGDESLDDHSLVLVLAEREIERMGGRVESELTSSGSVQVTVRFPLEPTAGGAS
jgi:hypothetical protein